MMALIFFWLISFSKSAIEFPVRARMAFLAYPPREASFCRTRSPNVNVSLKRGASDAGPGGGPPAPSGGPARGIAPLACLGIGRPRGHSARRPKAFCESLLHSLVDRGHQAG